MEGKLVLDEKSFKALSSESRVGILKSLKARRRTLSELSKKLSLGPSTVKEHCDVLKKAGLIEQMDEGRKWKYYALTEKGRNVIAPDPYGGLQVLVTLCITALVFGGFLFFIASGMLGGTGIAPSREMESGGIVSADYETEPVTYPSDTFLEKNTDFVYLVGEKSSAAAIVASVTAALVTGIILGWFFKYRRT